MKKSNNISKGFSLILTVWLVGLLTYIAGSTFAIFVFKKLNIDQAYYYLFEVLLKGDSNRYAANFSILLIVCMFIASIIFYFILKFLLFKILKINRLENYFNSNLELLNQWLTLGVVFFGFFPLFLSLVNVDGDLTKEINVLVLIFSAGFFVPYVSLLVESIFGKLWKESGEMNQDKKKKQETTTKKYKLVRTRSHAVSIKNRNSWTFTIATLMVIGTVCILLILGKVKIDSATLLSLTLAFFSIYLSAQFYFKATEQSNRFYDRSYNHTRDIAMTLSAMEGKFGEGLRNIENHNIKLNDKIERIPLESINRKNDEIEIVVQEKERLIQELLDKSSIEEGKREEYKQQLLKFESQNYDLKRQLEKLISKSNNTEETSDGSVDLKNMMKNPNVHPGFLHKLLYDVGPNKILSSSDIEIGRVFDAYKEVNIPNEVLKALHHLNYIDNENKITELGINILKSLAEDFIN